MLMTFIPRTGQGFTYWIKWCLWCRCSWLSFMELVKGSHIGSSDDYDVDAHIFWIFLSKMHGSQGSEEPVDATNFHTFWLFICLFVCLSKFASNIVEPIKLQFWGKLSLVQENLRKISGSVKSFVRKPQKRHIYLFTLDLLSK